MTKKITLNPNKTDSVVEKYKNITIYRCDALKQDLLNTIDNNTASYYSTCNRYPVDTIAEVKRDLDGIERCLKEQNMQHLFYEEPK